MIALIVSRRRWRAEVLIERPLRFPQAVLAEHHGLRRVHRIGNHPLGVKPIMSSQSKDSRRVYRRTGPARRELPSALEPRASLVRRD